MNKYSISIYATALISCLWNAQASNYNTPPYENEPLSLSPTKANEFSFENHGIIEHLHSALVPTTVVLKFEKNRVIDNSHGFYLSINLISYGSTETPLQHIGYISGEVIAGECPSRYSDGIYEFYGKHIRLSHFDINKPYQSRGLGKYALKQFFSIFDKIALPYKLEVNNNNRRAFAFFKQFGFAKVENVDSCHFDGVTSLMHGIKK